MDYKRYSFFVGGADAALQCGGSMQPMEGYSPSPPIDHILFSSVCSFSSTQPLPSLSHQIRLWLAIQPLRIDTAEVRRRRQIRACLRRAVAVVYCSARVLVPVGEEKLRLLFPFSDKPAASVVAETSICRV